MGFGHASPGDIGAERSGPYEQGRATTQIPDPRHDGSESILDDADAHERPSLTASGWRLTSIRIRDQEDQKDQETVNRYGCHQSQAAETRESDENHQKTGSLSKQRS
jgi:hypothetical protein